MRLASIFHLTLRILLWTGLGLFLAVNIAALAKYPPTISSALILSLMHPFSVQSHLSAAQILQEKGFLTQAKRELVIARDLQKNNNTVLGENTGLTDLLSRMEQEPVRISKLYEYWKSVTRKKPQYRDGFMMAGLYAYRLGYKIEATGLLEQAVLLDANYAPLNTLLDIIREK